MNYQNYQIDIENELPAITNIENPLEYLFNIVASCFLKEIRYYDNSDQRTKLITDALHLVRTIDPEFILQLAFYLRNKLYIRTTANFILAYCSLHSETATFLEKYFRKSIHLPTDMIEVCQYAQYIRLSMTMNQYQLKEIDIRQNIKLSHQLIKCIQGKFGDFSEYQLGKYCSDNNRKKMLFSYKAFKNVALYNQKIQKKVNKQKAKDQKIIGNQNPQQLQKLAKKQYIKNKMIKKHNHGIKKSKFLNQPKNWWDLKFICMKDLIKICHIKEPQYLIKCILNIPYPKTYDEFNQAFSEAEQQKYKLKFKSDQVKTKLKVQIPKTWETEVSSNGNKPEVWEKLIMGNSLPYMATLRNLKNIIQAGVSDECHQKIIATLCNQGLVENSKIFPFQYFTALSEIDKFQDEKKMDEENIQAIVEEKKENQVKQKQNQEQIKKNVDRFNQYYCESYCNAIQTAIGIAVDKNLQQIKGHTIIFTDVSGSMCTPISGGKKYGSITQCMEVALLLGLMIRQKCDNCTYYIFSSVGNTGKCYSKVNLEGYNILKNMKQLLEDKEKLGGGTDFPVEVIKECTQKQIMVDNIIILSDMMISDGYTDIGTTNDIITEYKNKINTNLKVFSIDLEGFGQSINLGQEFNDKNFIRIFGMSDSILSFISIRENSQIDAIKQFSQEQL